MNVCALELKQTLKMSATGRSYTQNFCKVQYIIIHAIIGRKSMRKFEKIFHVCKVFDRKYNSHADMRTPRAQLLEKGCQHGKEDSKNKILSQKEYITGEKVKIIEIIFLFCLPAG